MILTPTDRIVEMLTSVGYQPVPLPLAIAGLTFDFPAVFLGDDRSLDLILVADMAFDDQKRLLQKVEGVARTLDVIRSKRALTLILAGPRPDGDVLESMARVCRVLPLNTAISEDADADMRNSLAVLLPLQVPRPTAAAGDPLQQVRLLSDEFDTDIAHLIDIAPDSAAAVEAELHSLLIGQLPLLGKETKQ
jgi:hypothetical protein